MPKSFFVSQEYDPLREAEHANGYILEVEADPENNTFLVAVYSPPRVALKFNQMKLLDNQPLFIPPIKRRVAYVMPKPNSSLFSY